MVGLGGGIWDALKQLKGSSSDALNLLEGFWAVSPGGKTAWGSFGMPLLETPKDAIDACPSTQG